MFWKKKKTPKEPSKNECEHEYESNSADYATRVLKRETEHAKVIIDGKLYDTEKAIIISATTDNRLLFVTKKGNYFSCATHDYNYAEAGENEIFYISVIAYSDIRPEPIEYVMSNIGKYEPEKYIELFGEVEEA